MDFISLIALGLFVILCLNILRKPRQNLNEPPLVSYYFPVIGHTIQYFLNTENFIKKCHQQYGEIFSLYVFGQVITIVGKKLSPEITKNHKDFSFFYAFTDIFPIDSLFGRPITFFENVTKVIRDQFSANMDRYTNNVQDIIKKSFDKFIGDCEDPKCIKSPHEMLMQIVARSMVNIILGKELSNDDELINTFANLTKDFTPLLSMPPLLNFINNSLHLKVLLIRLKYTNYLYKRHRSLILNRLTSIIKQREHKKSLLGDAWKPPSDILESFIDLSTKDGSVDLQELTDYIIDIVFVAVHTTSLGITMVLYEYGARSEYWKELLEENEIISNSVKDGYLDSQDINKMIKLDSFIKETFLKWASIVGLQHKTLNDHFTFSNGYQVPKGRNVYIYLAKVHNTDQIASTFDGFRHVERNSSATRTEDGYLTFGRGRHACPGRFFAIHEIKLIMYFLLRKYKFETKDKNIIKPVFAGPFIMPVNDELIFQNLMSIN